MTDEYLDTCIDLLCQRQAMLATTGDDGPNAGMVAVVASADGDLLLHVSRLAAHTRQILAQPQVALLLCQPDDESTVADVQTLPRLTIYGTAQVVPRDHPDYAPLQQVYLQRLPAATMLFEFTDFVLCRVVIDRGRFVGGFAQARNLARESLVQASMAAFRRWSSPDH
ncbi:MAG: pyridoxamine 5'-phosphate oxidase family protein [Roseiflexaceae bacterium]